LPCYSYSGKLKFFAEYVAASQIALQKYLNIEAVSQITPLFNMALSQNLPLIRGSQPKLTAEYVAVCQILPLHIIAASHLK
jgi:hypothetical protein